MAQVDAQAIAGLSFASGFGKARHIKRAELWIQDLLERGECELRETGGEQSR